VDVEIGSPSSRRLLGRIGGIDGRLELRTVLFSVVDPLGDAVLGCEVAVVGLWGVVVLSHGDVGMTGVDWWRLIRSICCQAIDLYGCAARS
jgi:hypothetical protein